MKSKKEETQILYPSLCYTCLQSCACNSYFEKRGFVGCKTSWQHLEFWDSFEADEISECETFPGLKPFESGESYSWSGLASKGVRRCECYEMG